MTDSSSSTPSGDPPGGVPVCPRHPDRASYIRCQRYGRPVCPDCQRPAAVGVQCVDCVREGARTAPTARTRFGAPVRSGAAPVVTYTLMGLCATVFVGQLLLPALTSRLAFVGVLTGVEPWRLVTSAFVHSPRSILHILFNMYVLFAFGPMLESVLGRAKFLVTYLLCAIGGSVGVLLFSRFDPGWFVPVVGASGAIFGIVLVYVVLATRTGGVPTQLLVLLGLNVLLPVFVPNIAWQAHLGGAVTGAVIGALLLATSAAGRSAEAQRRRRLIWPALCGLLVLLLVICAARLLQVMGPVAFGL